MRYQNRQLYCECQLVAIWNACRYWNRTDLPAMGTKEYYDACDEACAIAGGVIDIDKQLKKYGVKTIKGSASLTWIRSHLPVHTAIFCHKGYHSVLIVNVEGRDVTLANYATNRLHRMKWERLKSMINKRVAPAQYIVRKV